MKSQAAAMEHWQETLYRWLSAPLLLTVAGALLINYLIPQITAKSQRSKEALETKASLVRDMTEATTAAVGTSRLVAMDVIKKEEVEKPRRDAAQQAAFNDGLQSWEVRRANIGSRLEAYFPKPTSSASESSRLASDWREFAEVATNAFFLSATGLNKDRDERIKRVRRYLAEAGSPKSHEFWKRLRAGDSDVGRTADFRAAYVDLGNEIVKIGDRLVHRVLDADISGF